MKGLVKNSLPFFKRFWPVGLLVIIVLLFFWKVILKGEAPFPGDFTVGVYFPWLDYKWGYPAGVPVKNPIMADVPSFMYPMQIFAVNILKTGFAPLWNPLILGGTPLLANFQSAPYSPTNFVYFLTDSITGWSIQIILQHILGAIFTYLLLRYWKVSKTGSVLGGVIFAFAGFNLIWSQWNGHALPAAFIPLAILFTDRWLRETKIIFGTLLSVVLGLQILSGYPQVVLYTALALGLLYLVRLKDVTKPIRATVFLVLFGGLAIGLTAFQVLPGAELLKYSQRTFELHPFDWAFLPWQKAITFIAPDFYGNHATQNYWGLQDYTSNTGMVGVVGITLALLALSLIKKSREVFYCFAISLFALVLAFPTPISIWLWKSGFLGFNAASAHRSLVIWNLGVALLAGFGFDSLGGKLNFKFKLISLIIPAGLLIGFGIYALKIGEVVAIRNIILPGIVFVLVAVVILIGAKIKYVLLLIAIVELFYFGWKFTPFSDPKLIFPKTPVIEFLQNIEKPNRVVADKVIPINFLMNYDIETFEGYDAVYSKEISNYVAAVNGGYGSFNSTRRYAIVDNYDSNLLDIANVKYFVVMNEDLEKYLKNEKFRKVFSDKSVAVLANLKVLPRQFEIQDWEIERDDGIVLQKLTEAEFSGGNKIILSETPPYDVKTMLFISDTFYPGWKAYVNGVETKIYRANYAFRAIAVPGGEYEVRFLYQPDTFYNGFKISLVSALVIVGTIGYTLMKRKARYEKN